MAPAMLVRLPYGKDNIGHFDDITVPVLNIGGWFGIFVNMSRFVLPVINR